MDQTDYVIFASYGNDSIALIQFMHERGYGSNVISAYTDTGWAAEWWGDRVAKAEAWAQSLGFRTVRIASEGMQSLVERKKAWPRGGGGKYQFCTEALKKEPARAWLDKIDPFKDVTCAVGIRREESDNRANFPMWTGSSDDHGGRELYAPLVMHTELMRNELIAKTPIPILPHRSKECSPCVNARKPEIRHMSDADAKKVFWLEQKMGVNSKGNDRVMFSPARHNGAVGILAVIEDAKHGHDDLFQTVSCDAAGAEPDMPHAAAESEPARPWEQEPDEPEHDDTERCPNTGDLFEGDDDADEWRGFASAAEQRKKNLIQFMRSVQRQFLNEGQVSESVAIGVMADCTHNQL